MVINGIFFDLTIIILVAAVGSLIAKYFKQPLIPVYILSGLMINFVSPLFGHQIDQEIVKTFAEIGIAFLLFVVGLELDFKRIKSIGFIASVGGSLQVLILFLIAFLATFLMGFTTMQSVYVGVALAFSSTLVVIKLLSDAKEVDTLHGRIIIGILLMQDIIAIFALSVLNVAGGLSSYYLAAALAKAVVLLVFAVVFCKYVFPSLFRFAAKSTELLLLLSLAVLFAVSAFTVYLDFSIVIGGFIAGITLASLPYNFEIIARVKSLRDFFAILFFFSLGMQMVLSGIDKVANLIIVMIFFVLLVKPLVTMILTSMFGYAQRTSFLTGISLAQVSEFGLIIVAQGLMLGHIGKEFMSLVIILAIISITISTYFIEYDSFLFKKLSRFITPLLRFTKSRHEIAMPRKKDFDVLIVGCDRVGFSIVKTLKKMRKKVIVVDYNPDVVRHLRSKKIPCLYGDISDIDIIERINLNALNYVISTMPALDVNTVLLKAVRKHNKKALVFLTAHDVDEALELYDIGADYVILPHFLGGHHVSVLLEESTKDFQSLLKTKKSHIKELRHRVVLGHRHPKNQ